jgi:hypothetical protein|tara:strand:- start:50 stop:271 length:222 start_codon:yes stop_codon:yes gene_type:complete
MSDVEVVIDAYKILKEYIPAKDMQLASDHFVEDMGEILDEQDLFKLGGVDKYLKASVKDLLGEEDFELEEDEY